MTALFAVLTLGTSFYKAVFCTEQGPWRDKMIIVSTIGLVFAILVILRDFFGLCI